MSESIKHVNAARRNEVMRRRMKRRRLLLSLVLLRAPSAPRTAPSGEHLAPGERRRAWLVLPLRGSCHVVACLQTRGEVTHVTLLECDSDRHFQEVELIIGRNDLRMSRSFFFFFLNTDLFVLELSSGDLFI